MNLDKKILLLEADAKVGLIEGILSFRETQKTAWLADAKQTVFCMMSRLAGKPFRAVWINL